MTVAIEGLGTAVVGRGQDGIATLIETVTDIAYRTPDGAPAAKIIVIESQGVARPKGDMPYPLGGLEPAQMHPFSAVEPPAGFPRFGQYVKDMLPDHPDMQDALVAPTYRQINGYLDYMLELAVVSFADEIRLDIDRRVPEGDTQLTPNGPVTIHFTDGSQLIVARVVRARRPPHMGGAV